MTEVKCKDSAARQMFGSWSHRSTLPWEAEKGIWAISLSHALQHGQQLDGMRRLIDKRKKQQHLNK